jgi:hypothetical protein
LENLNGRDYSEDTGIIIIHLYFGNRVWGAGWIHLAQDRDRRQAFVNTVMNLRVP